METTRRPFQVTSNTPSQEIVIGLLRDWGTGLDRGLYIEAVTHFLGGPDAARQPVDTLWNGTVVGRQLTTLVASDTAFEITCLRTERQSYESHLQRFLANTSLDRVFWVNAISGEVTFVLLET